jgi:hypothetical protein
MFQAYPAIALQCLEQNEQANRFFLKDRFANRYLPLRGKQKGPRGVISLLVPCFSDCG